MDIVVIGGGMAGTRLAQQLAPCGAVRVTVVGEEPHPPYNRVLLAEVLAGRYAPGVIALPDGGTAAGPPRRAVLLDRAARRVVCDDGHEVRYDRLVLATGSNPVLPPLRGLFTVTSHELPAGVHAFRTMDDCLALARAAGPGTRVVVVGGGLLGVSAAQALAARGAQVVLAQQAEHLMERHLDPAAADLLRRHLEDQGVEVHTQCRVRGIRVQPCDGPAGRRVTTVELADGYCLGTDLLVLACGVRPRTGLALAAGIAVGRGVVVDDRLRTSDPAVFAIGDCAQHDGVVHGLAGAAREQADVLARVLAAEAGSPAEAGEPAGYRGTRALTRLTLTRPRSAQEPQPPGAAAGTGPRGPFDLAAFGDPVPAEGDDVLQLADATRGAYRKVVVRGDRLVGGILLGDLAAVGAVARTWEDDEPLPAAPLIHLLTNDGGPRA
ncbi:NAD(P)/FAD-dependent oxidoreductase [Actinacidiphila rubida]|uniref:Assimilatory nitrate reductase electron transfer subunit n=1 Tax=Actinacidiphila rubida TaxID=310780 RepID=A0A1H8FAH1_9ACTN|nr:FAD-dependent oxidoreductase [Actinacidiphila rubida]SEN28038.1 assimilatory nitrate reductase electron transfer subunit [Actinacidiphila rubida]